MSIPHEEGKCFLCDNRRRASKLKQFLAGEPILVSGPDGQAHQVQLSGESGPPGSAVPGDEPTRLSGPAEQMKLLVDTLEYSIRNTRHLIDACWNEHTATHAHPRKGMEQWDNGCVTCLQLMGADQQNGQLMVQVIQLNRDMFPRELPDLAHGEAEMRHERLENGELVSVGTFGDPDATVRVYDDGP